MSRFPAPSRRSPAPAAPPAAGGALPPPGVAAACGALWVALLTGASPADAQSESEIVLDDNSLERAPLGQPQAVGDGFLWRITEQQGTPSGENLFFGFKFFSVGANDTALFTSDGAESVEMIKRIIARVTGNSRSEILGKLSVDSVFSNFEDLFLLNPAGILFGPRSSLDIPGSAFFSSADELRFGGTDTIVFPTGSDERPTVLATAAPTEFGFIGDEARDARPIELDLWDESGGVGTTLFLAEGTRLTLVGEGVDIHRNPSSVGDAIDARSSTVAIASVGSGDVTVPVDVTSPDFQPKAMASESLGPVTIGNGARIVADSSFVLVSRPTGRVVIRAGSFALGSFPTQDGSEPTAGGELVMENVAGPSAPEAAVDIETTETLEIRDGSAVRVVSGKGQAGGSAGEIRLAGGEVVVQGPGTRVLNEAFFASGTETRLEGDTVRVADGAEVGSDATLLGKGGDIVVRGESLAVAGGSIVAQATLLGEGGNVDVDVSGDVSVTRSDSPVEGFDARPVGRIAAQATAGATMPAGNVQIRAASISVESAAPDEGRVDDLGVPSQIASLTQAANAGATGGDVRLEALTLNLTGGGQLLAITTNGATGGNIEVDAASITIDGAPTDGEALEAGSPTSQIAAITRGASEAASGGDVAIVTESLRLTGGGEVLALTTGEADAGTITVNGGLASDGLTPVTARLVEVSGQLDDPTGGPPTSRPRASP